MTAFTRQSTGGTFVAYTKDPSRKPVAIKVGDGVETVRVHPEVFIQEYPSIKVKEITAAEKGDGLRVMFDPGSVPVKEGQKSLTKAIAVNTQAGGDIEKVLRWALEHNEAVYLGVEYRRKFKTPAGEVIPFDDTILSLRGFDEDGKPTDTAQATSLANISKVIAVVGRQSDPQATVISPEVQSDPMQWVAHRDNRVGKTPAEGWVRTTREDGTAGGAAISRDKWRELTAGASSLDASIVDSIVNALADRLNLPAGGRGDQLSDRASRSVEGRRYDAYNSDGRVNPGSFAVDAVIAARAAALTAIEAINYTEAREAETGGRAPQLLTRAEISEAATRLTVTLVTVADKVQSVITGNKANRIDGSHLAASKIVTQVVTRDVPMSRAIYDDDELKKRWLEKVVENAIEIARMTVEVTTEHLQALADPTPVNDASGRAQREVARQNPAEAPSTSARSTSSRPANSGVKEPATPDFATDDTQNGAPVTSIKQRNIATLNPLLSSTQLQPQDVLPVIKLKFRTEDLECVDPQSLADTVAAWMKDPSRFREYAFATAQAATAAS